ncbi:glucose-6-phosphate isomerase [Actinoplanes sp. NPDC049668]|uniref:glucose-6-phosphate isomerase n=1 Tax=unclassified Actinoplanes TaxID=2626549 RepID=UPI0033B1B45F
MTDGFAVMEAAAGLAVFGGPAAASRHELVARGVPGLLASGDPTLWGPAAEAGAKAALEFLDAGRRDRELLPLIAELREELGDLTDVVLAGPGGTAEVAARTLGRRLTVLDDPDPQRVRALIDDGGRLRRTLVVLRDDGLLEPLRQAWLDLGYPPAEAARHFVALSGPVPGIIDVPGDPGALTALAFAGVDVAELIDEAELFAPSLAGDHHNPALALGVALAGAGRIALVPDGTGIEGLGEWAADLVTGALGLLAIEVESPAAAGSLPGDVLIISYGGSLAPGAVPGGGVRPDLAVNGPLGAQFLAWRYAVAIAARVRGVDPFRSFEPETAVPEPGAPSFVEGAVEIFTTGGATDLGSALRELLADVDDHLAVRAFLDRDADAAVAGVRPLLAAACPRPVSFGWGRYHRGGPRNGAFLQITGLAAGDVRVPGEPHTLGDRQAARAAGDRRALRREGRPLLRLHLTDRAEGVRQLLAAAGTLPHRPSPVRLRGQEKLAGWARG